MGGRRVRTGGVIVKLQALMCKCRNSPQCKEAKSGEGNERIKQQGIFLCVSLMPCACHGVRLLSKGTFPGGQSVFPGVGDFFSSSLQCSWNPGGLNRIRAQSLWLSESHTYLSRCPKIKSVIWPRGSEFAWKEDNYEVSREGRMGSSPSLFSVIEGLDCSRTIHMDTVSSLCLSDVYLNIITNFAGLHFS